MYRRISDALRKEIRDGVHAPGKQIPTEAEMVSHFGVSRITVRRALQELINEGLLIGRPGRGTFVNTSPCVQALNVLFVHANDSALTYPYTYQTVDGIQQYSQAGHPLRMEMVPRPPVDQQSPDDRAVEDLVSYGKLDGVIAMPRIHPDAMKRLVDQGVPVVVIGSSQLYDAPPGVIRVGIGPEHPSAIALRHVKEIGRERVAVVGAAVAGSQIVKRSVIDAMHQFGIEFNEARYELAGWGIGPGRDAAEQLIGRCPDLDAIITSDDLQALGVLHTLARHGRRVPEDIAVVGLGNMLDGHLDAELTTVDARIREAGLLAAQCLHRAIAGKPVEEHNLLAPRLIRRKTT